MIYPGLFQMFEVTALFGSKFETGNFLIKIQPRFNQNEFLFKSGAKNLFSFFPSNGIFFSYNQTLKYKSFRRTHFEPFK